MEYRQRYQCQRRNENDYIRWRLRESLDDNDTPDLYKLFQIRTGLILYRKDVCIWSIENKLHEKKKSNDVALNGDT
jgi:hypothetical protein